LDWEQTLNFGSHLHPDVKDPKTGKFQLCLTVLFTRQMATPPCHDVTVYAGV